MELIAKKLDEYDKLRAEKKVIEEQLKKLGADIQKYAEEHGVKDEKGSYYSENGTFVYGKTARKTVKLNQEKALHYLKLHNFGDCIETEEVVNEDALAAKVSDGKISQKDLESFTDVKVTYSVSVTKKETEEDMPEIQETKAEKSVNRPVFRRRK